MTLLNRIWTGLLSLWQQLSACRIPGRYAFLVFGIAIAFFVQLYNSYGLATASEEGNTRLLQSILAPVMPHNPAPRDMITVVVYDQASFDDLELDVSILPYERQAELIRKVAAMQPAAIFIDANYRRDLSDSAGLTELHKAIADLNAGDPAQGVAPLPVYIGEVKGPRTQSNTPSPEDFFSDAPAAPSSREAALTTFAAFRKDAQKNNWESGTMFTTEHSLDYPALTGRLFPATAGQPDTIETPAFRLYRDVCNWQAAAGGRSFQKTDLRCDDLKPQGKDLPPLAIQWLSYSRASGPADASNPACRSLNRSAAMTFAADIAHNLFRRPARAKGYVTNPCTYLRTFRLNEVLGAPGPETLENDFRGKAVLIGSALGDDSFNAPGQGKVPGVFLHAMALENLLAFGKNYHRWPQEVHLFGGSIGADFFLELALALLANVVAHRIEARLGKGKAPHQSALLPYFATVLALSLLFGAVAIVVTHVWLHWTPVNVLAIVTATLAVAGLEKYNELLLVGRKWSLSGIATVLISAALLSWLIVSLFIMNAGDGAKIGWPAAVLGLWTVFLIYGYRMRCAGAIRTLSEYLGRVYGTDTVKRKRGRRKKGNGQ